MPLFSSLLLALAPRLESFALRPLFPLPLVPRPLVSLELDRPGACPLASLELAPPGKHLEALPRGTLVHQLAVYLHLPGESCWQTCLPVHPPGLYSLSLPEHAGVVVVWPQGARSERLDLRRVAGGLGKQATAARRRLNIPIFRHAWSSISYPAAAFGRIPKKRNSTPAPTDIVGEYVCAVSTGKCRPFLLVKRGRLPPYKGEQIVAG
mmetsp:Transcript_163561/g.314095  ORF Transcript_163561/g.314095 Transcript_163561/m.314095 type:complete len:208 (-) Transcript_163561:4-627(-)